MSAYLANLINTARDSVDPVTFAGVVALAAIVGACLFASFVNKYF